MELDLDVAGALAALTAHLQNALFTTADAAVNRALLGRLLRRVAPPL
ncbi:hypothetical protein [Streptomyces sp. NPDC050485]